MSLRLSKGLPLKQVIVIHVGLFLLSFLKISYVLSRLINSFFILKKCPLTEKLVRMLFECTHTRRSIQLKISADCLITCMRSIYEKEKKGFRPKPVLRKNYRTKNFKPDPVILFFMA